MGGKNGIVKNSEPPSAILAVQLLPFLASSLAACFARANVGAIALFRADICITSAV